MSGTVFTSAIGKVFTGSMRMALQDGADGYDQTLDYKDWMEVDSLSKHYEDDVEYGGPALLSEKPEGQALETVTMREGNTYRWRAKTYGGKMMVTEETIEDEKMHKVVNAASRLRLSAWDTVDVLCTTFASEFFTVSNPLGGDNLSLFHASHTLPGGGTWSNTLATPMAPSTLAIQTMRTQASRFPGYNGITRGHALEQICCPTEQEMPWWAILESDKVPGSNNNDVNTVKRLGIKVKALKHWQNTSTQWFAQTDCHDKITLRWKRKFKTNSWATEDNMVMNFSISWRMVMGYNNPRCAIGSNA